MKNDLPAAALRLMQSLPTRTHHQTQAVAPPGAAWTRLRDGMRAASAYKRVVTGKGRGGNNSRPILIDGAEYASIKAVTRHFKVSNTTVYNWLGTGRAKYARERP